MKKKSLTPTLLLLWLGWWVILYGFQLLVNSRLDIGRPDFAVPWTPSETKKFSNAGKIYLAVNALRERLSGVMVFPDTDLARGVTAATGEQIAREVPLLALLKRPAVTLASIGPLLGLAECDDPAAQQVEIEAKYEGYIKRQDEEIAKVRRHASIALPADFSYDTVDGLSHELRQKLSAALPETPARAARIPGMTPAALSLLLVHARKLGGEGELARRA